jgi:hypothetical protein
MATLDRGQLMHNMPRFSAGLTAALAQICALGHRMSVSFPLPSSLHSGQSHCQWLEYRRALPPLGAQNNSRHVFECRNVNTIGRCSSATSLQLSKISRSQGALSQSRGTAFKVGHKHLCRGRVASFSLRPGAASEASREGGLAKLVLPPKPIGLSKTSDLHNDFKSS